MGCTCAPGTASVITASTSCNFLTCGQGYDCAGGTQQPLAWPGTTCNSSTSGCSLCTTGWTCAGGTTPAIHVDAGWTTVPMFYGSDVTNQDMASAIGTLVVSSVVTLPAGDYAYLAQDGAVVKFLQQKSLVAGYYLGTFSSFTATTTYIAKPGGYYRVQQVAVPCATGFSCTLLGRFSWTVGSGCRCPQPGYAVLVSVSTSSPSTPPTCTTINTNACPLAAVPGYYCVGEVITIFPAGSYCPAAQPLKFKCPAGYYCPAGTSNPTPCTYGSANCPAGSVAPCPLGSCCFGAFEAVCSASSCPTNSFPPVSCGAPACTTASSGCTVGCTPGYSCSGAMSYPCQCAIGYASTSTTTTAGCVGITGSCTACTESQYCSGGAAQPVTLVPKVMSRIFGTGGMRPWLRSARTVSL